jgi:hypothetical protein
MVFTGVGVEGSMFIGVAEDVRKLLTGVAISTLSSFLVKQAVEPVDAAQQPAATDSPATPAKSQAFASASTSLTVF